VQQYKEEPQFSPTIHTDGIPASRQVGLEISISVSEIYLEFPRNLVESIAAKRFCQLKMLDFSNHIQKCCTDLYRLTPLLHLSPIMDLGK